MKGWNLRRDRGTENQVRQPPHHGRESAASIDRNADAVSFETMASSAIGQGRN